MLTTSFALLRAADACVPRYRHLAEALGGIRTYGRDAPITLVQVLDANGLYDALWALRAVPAHEVPLRDRLARLFACDCAERVLPIVERDCQGEARPRNAVAVARRYAAGHATGEELAAARAATYAADAAADAYADAYAAAYAAYAADAADAADAAADAEKRWQADHFRALLEASC
jgi:hypothetical protein